MYEVKRHGPVDIAVIFAANQISRNLYFFTPLLTALCVHPIARVCEVWKA